MVQEGSRGLGKTIDFMRAVSTLPLVMNIYYFCHPFFHAVGCTNGMMGRILLNFRRDAGLFTNSPVTKYFSLMFLFFSSMGVEGQRVPEIARRRISCYLVVGLSLYWGSELFPTAGWSVPFTTLAYVSTLAAGYICLLTVGIWAGRLLREYLMDGVFNEENESFMQKTRLTTNEYSANLPVRFHYKKEQHDGWIDVILSQRGCIVIGPPGSGKNYCIISQLIKQQTEKGYALYCCDFKLPDLSLIAYSHLFKNKDKYRANVQFYIINLDDPRYSRRCNPINPTFMLDVADAYEPACMTMLDSNRTWVQKRDDLFVESPVVLFTAIIRYLEIYGSGEYCTFLHAIELPDKFYSDILTILASYRKLEDYLSPFTDAQKGGAMGQLQDQITNAKIPLSRMISPSLYWIMSGDDFMLDINNPDEPKVLCAGNNLDRQSIYPAALRPHNARVVRAVNREGKLKRSILVDKVPTIYFKGLDTLVAMARSNKVAICLGTQNFGQLVRNYGEKKVCVIQSTVGNVFSGQVLGETAKNLSKRFGRVFQQRKSVNITCEDTSTGISTQLDSLMSTLRISNLSQGMFVGSVCDGFQEKMEQKIFHCEIVVDNARMVTETKAYKPIPVVTNFTGGDGKGHMRGEMERSYYRIEEEMGGTIQKELRHIENDPNLKHLLETEGDGRQQS